MYDILITPKCDRQKVKLRRCPCKTVYYCSKECQAARWSLHIADCTKGARKGSNNFGGFEIVGTGLNARSDIESLAESAGDGSVSAEGICAGTGAGIARGASTVYFVGDNGVSNNAGVDVLVPLLEEAPTSTETVSSRPLSTAICLVSA